MNSNPFIGNIPGYL